MSLSNYLPLCDALVLLFRPLVEVVIHDLATDKICFINGNLSGRKIGDPSLLEREALEEELHRITYPKVNFDGRIIKSISVPIEKSWLICINCDVSIFNEMKKLGSLLVMRDCHEPPQSLFKNDWQERLHVAINGFITDKKWQFKELTNRQKKDLIRHLYENGAFLEKNAADYVARTLSLGRATVFNYLREWRKK